MATGLPGEHEIRQGLGQILAQAALFIDAERLEQPTQKIGSEDDGSLRSNQRLRMRASVSHRYRGVLDRGQLTIGPHSELGVVGLKQFGILGRYLCSIDERHASALHT